MTIQFDQQKYQLSEAMQQFVYWHSVYVAADSEMDSIRAAYDQLCVLYTPERNENIEIVDHVVITSTVAIPIRIYYPKSSTRPQHGWPCVMYLHGGGWMLGGLDSHEFLLRSMCEDLNVAVLSVDYRLAPEHRFPAAYLDSEAVYLWLKAQATSWYIDPSKIIVAGDSAGGNLAAALAIQLQHMDIQAQGLVLIYPVLCTNRHRDQNL